jgi:hypothetical protein
MTARLRVLTCARHPFRSAELVAWRHRHEAEVEAKRSSPGPCDTLALTRCGPSQFLFIVVIVLFGFMNIGAIIGLREDLKERAELLAHITRPESGFTERQDGVWTWTFRQNQLTRAVERPSGSAIEIATILGFPFIRLRAALPEECVPPSWLLQPAYAC